MWQGRLLRVPMAMRINTNTSRGRGSAGLVKRGRRVTALLFCSVVVGVGVPEAWAGDPLRPDPSGSGGTILRPDPAPIGARTRTTTQAASAFPNAAAPASPGRAATGSGSSQPQKGNSAGAARHRSSVTRPRAGPRTDASARRISPALLSIALDWLRPSVAPGTRAAPSLAPSTPRRFPLVAAALALIAVVLASAALVALATRTRTSLRART